MKKELEGILGKIPQDQNLTFNQKMLYLKEATTQILELVESKIPSEERMSKIIYQMINNGLDDKDSRFDNGLCRDLAQAIRAEVMKGLKNPL